ncbi:MAG: EAL domain-containing response regulator [Alphaproteobacteria bacterium]|jgi:EAL domain-containing protein (putative c-di-GMP-specific phosphodiesterase class I)/ActR/RegA family two-component response regulator|nr:EAL domain-containing response regulator [Alphaproteobacteria bacterium]
MNDSSAISNISFLIVDDEPFIVKVVSRMLQGMGATTIASASNGHEALDIVKTASPPPDVVLCDLNMPGMDGIEVLRHLAENGYGGNVILFSGEDKKVLDTAQTLARAHDLRILGTIEKPVKRDVLESMIAEISAQSQATGGARDFDVSAEDLRQALDSDALTVNFQPKVSVADKSLYGFETLVRWIHPEKGFIPPDFFVRLAEEHGMIDDLTEAVCRMALGHAGAWVAEGLNTKIAINLSVDNLANLAFPEWIVGLAMENGVDPGNLILEVTETRIMQDIIKPLEILTRMRLKSIGLSIDDFGTGASSMEQLQRIPFTELKIDRAFVHHAGSNPQVGAMLEACASLAHKLDLNIIAEGVEDEDDWAAVARAGCHYVQGYFIARPMPADDFFAWQADWPPAG